MTEGGPHAPPSHFDVKRSKSAPCVSRDLLLLKDHTSFRVTFPTRSVGDFDLWRRVSTSAFARACMLCNCSHASPPERLSPEDILLHTPTPHSKGLGISAWQLTNCQLDTRREKRCGTSTRTRRFGPPMWVVPTKCRGVLASLLSASHSHDA